MTLPGFSGHLVSRSCLAKRIAAGVAGPDDGPSGALAAVCAGAARQLGPASSLGAIRDVAVEPLLKVLGLESCGNLAGDGSTLIGTARAGHVPVVVIVAAWGERLDAFWRRAIAEAQERSASWALLCNGAHARIVDACRLYSRRYVDFDLVVAGGEASSLAAVLCVAGARALGADRGDPLSLHALVAESDREAAGVCRSLRHGVLTASAEVLQALVPRGARPRDDAFDQALTVVYRMVFLLFAEARTLVPLWHPVYRESYSVESLRAAAERSAPPRGTWDALRAMARLAHAGCRAGDLRVTPFNGRLFAPGRTPLAERRDLDDGAARRAVLALSTRRATDRDGTERIAYGDLGVEQLGAVYETLLDYRPAWHRGTAVGLKRTSGARRATGTFYTPRPIADFLVRRTLGPLVRGRSADQILELRVVDPAMGSGACLVSACRFLASAYEQALIAGGVCRAGDIDQSDRAAFRRRVTERCLYGVDLNPMAVQLARLSLWLTSLAADRPLSFLDHRLASGDSLVGAWLSSLRRAPAAGRRAGWAAPMPLLAEAEAEAGALQDALPIRFSLETIPNDTVEQVRAKERALAGLQAAAAGLPRWKRVADLWCAIWFDRARRIPAAAFGALADTLISGSGALPGHVADAALAAAQTIATARRFFHWELEFPEVFFDAGGRRLSRPGFDAVVGNPPWDMMRADEGDAGERERARADLRATVRFTREAGVYTAQSDGHANRYQLFVERAIALTRSEGRIGLVLPWGLAADHGSSALRRHLMTRCAIDALVGIDNHRALFPIHRSVRFLLLSATAGPSTLRFGCRLGVESMAELEAIGDEGTASLPVQLTPAALERLSGGTLAVPYLRSPLDLAVCEKAAALFPPLGSGDGWGARFGRELNATDDRAVFGPAGHGLPVLDGRHLAPFRADAAAATRSIRASDARRRLGADRIGRRRLAYRDVASATNRLTLIAALLPASTVSTHTVFCLRTPLPLRDQHFLCGLFNSFVVNYLARLRVTTHVTTAIVEGLPLPTVRAAPAAGREIAAIARRLSRCESPQLAARLNALVARMYQLTRLEFEHVLSTFPLVAASERRAASEAFGRLR